MITFHVGLHKTGSSSLQLALNMVAHRRDVSIFTPGSASLREHVAQAGQMARSASSRRIVISNEGFLGTVDDGYCFAVAALQDLRDSWLGLDYEIVAYIRPQCTWLPSAYLQFVQQGGTEGPDSFVARLQAQDNLHWSRLHRIVVEESGAKRVSFRVYERNRDVVEDFFQFASLGRPPRPTREGLRENPSILATQAPILAAVNSDPHVSEVDRTAIRHVLQQDAVLQGMQAMSPFPILTQIEIVNQYRDDWLALSDEVATTDVSEARNFAQLLPEWDYPPLPFAGLDLDSPAIKAAVVRTLMGLSARQETRQGISGATRLYRKLRHNPRDLMPAIVRHLRSS